VKDSGVGRRVRPFILKTRFSRMMTYSVNRGDYRQAGSGGVGNGRNIRPIIIVTLTMGIGGSGMFCPRCGTSQSEEMKFCKSCGVNLSAVRQAATMPDGHGKVDWSKTWVADMFLSQGERKRKEEEIERQRGITPEIKRYDEVKTGVITSSVGVGVMIFLLVIARGIIAAGVPAEAAAILSSVWVAGVIPFFIGLGIIINGVVVGKKIVEATRRGLQSPETTGIDPVTSRMRTLPPSSPDWPEPLSSVTENTTRQLKDSKQTD
jgi:hypothetical protein